MQFAVKIVGKIPQRGKKGTEVRVPRTLTTKHYEEGKKKKSHCLKRERLQIGGLKKPTTY